MTTRAKTDKPKAFYVWTGKDDWGLECWREAKRGPADGLLIPKGAPIPLPASVRRVMRAAQLWSKYISPKPDELEQLLQEALNAHQRAEKRLGRKRD